MISNLRSPWLSNKFSSYHRKCKYTEIRVKNTNINFWDVKGWRENFQKSPCKAISKVIQLTQHDVFLCRSTGDFSSHLSVCLGQQFEHALYFLVLVRWKCSKFTDTYVNYGNSSPFPISEGKSHVTLSIRVCSDGLWALHTFKQIVPDIWHKLCITGW